ncbi:MAG: AAA family ATPase [Hydrogenoanaerobacterium sp.]
MQSKVIAFWGSSGSGKTLLSAAAAGKLSKQKSKVVVISTDCNAPALPIFLPGLDILAAYSIGNILMSNNFEFSNIADKLHLHPNNPNLAFMGLTRGENITTYNSFERDKILKLIKTLSLELDYIIIDCMTQPLLDMMSLTALEIADVVIRSITPDNRGIEFQSTQLPLLSDSKFKTDRHIKVLSNIMPKSPVDAICKKLGDFDFFMPYSSEAAEKFIEGSEIKGFIKQSFLDDNSGYRFEHELNKMIEKVMKIANQSDTAEHY